jgi:hypothetical protein
MSSLLDEKREDVKIWFCFVCFEMDVDYDNNDDNVVMWEWIEDKRSKEDNKRCVK